MTDLARPTPEPPVRRKHKGFCGHEQVMLDEDDRSCTCEYCGERVDAFSVLLDYARNCERWTAALATAKRDTLAVEEALNDTKRQLRNAKAQLRSARKTWSGYGQDDPRLEAFPMPPGGMA